jgi:hypothetical protein
MGTINNFKFKLLKNFFSKKEIDVYSKYCKYRHICDNKDVDNIFNNKLEKFPDETCFFDDPLFESVLLNITKDVEKKCGLKLFPTYSYWRMYTYGASLPKHTDRSSCEISMTCHIGGSTNDWPIYMADKKIFTEPGDAIIYLGQEIPHERKILKHDFQTNVFFHWVDQNGPNTDNKYSARLIAESLNDF